MGVRGGREEVGGREGGKRKREGGWHGKEEKTGNKGHSI